MPYVFLLLSIVPAILIFALSLSLPGGAVFGAAFLCAYGALVLKLLSAAEAH